MAGPLAFVTSWGFACHRLPHSDIDDVFTGLTCDVDDGKIEDTGRKYISITAGHLRTSLLKPSLQDLKFLLSL